MLVWILWKILCQSSEFFTSSLRAQVSICFESSIFVELVAIYEQIGDKICDFRRGLSNHFSGKSKSFGNLSDMSCVNRVKDLEKPVNPFNKRRRLIMANKWSRKSSFYNWPNPKSMPLLALNEEDENDATALTEEEEEEHQQASPSSSSSFSEQEGQKDHIIPLKLSKLQERKFKASFKSQSCFSLTDLQEQHYQ